MNDALMRTLGRISGYEQDCLEMLHSGNMFTDYNPLHCHLNPSQRRLTPGKQIAASGGARFLRYAEHKHDFVEIIYVCAGTNTHIVNGKEVSQRRGELLLLNKNAKHERLPAREEDITVIFKLLPQFLDIPLAMLGGEDSRLRAFLKRCTITESQIGDYLHLKTADELQVKNLVENLSMALLFEKQSGQDTNPFTTGLLFLHLANHMRQTHLGAEQSELLLKIMQYIDQHYAAGSLNGLAKLLYYDAGWLSKDIIRLTGSTYTQLLQNKRVSVAKFLLEATNLPVAEIARHVGYTNTSHFHQLFRKQTGVTPGTYRENKLGGS